MPAAKEEDDEDDDEEGAKEGDEDEDDAYDETQQEAAAEALRQASAEGLELKMGTGGNGNGYRGVQQKAADRFEAAFRGYIGMFSTAEEAALAVARKKQDM